MQPLCSFEIVHARDMQACCCSTLQQRCPFSRPVDCFVRQGWSWEQEEEGGESLLPSSTSTTTLTPSSLHSSPHTSVLHCSGMDWGRNPSTSTTTLKRERHPATKHNANSIKCSLCCDLRQWMINWRSFSHCRIPEIAIMGRIVM